jgi:hypothetical protein
VSKHRTRENKEKAHHQFTLSWSPKIANTVSEAGVNRQFKEGTETANNKITPAEKAMFLAKDISIEATKKDLVTSLILVSFILGLELVIYLAVNQGWNIEVPFLRTLF